MEIVKRGIVNTANTAGILNIKEFEAPTMFISRELLEEALSVLKLLDEHGLKTENIEMGIVAPKDNANKTRNSKVLCIFLDAEKTLAYVIAGRVENE